MQHSIRLLSSGDSEDYQTLRLASLEWDPDSWLSSMEEEKGLPRYAFENQLTRAYFAPIFGYWGFFENNKLLAYAQLSPSSWNKKKHIATLHDVCVDKDHRRKSVGTKLIKFIINATKKVATLEKLQLYVTSNNTGATKFYESLGFNKAATIPEVVKEKDGRYQDEFLYVLNIKYLT